MKFKKSKRHAIASVFFAIVRKNCFSESCDEICVKNEMSRRLFQAMDAKKQRFHDGLARQEIACLPQLLRQDI